MRYIVLFALALLLCISAASSQTNGTALEEINASNLQSLVVDSSTKLESYRFSMDLEQNIELVNLSSGETQKLFTRSFGFGSANMTDHALKLVMASLAYADGDEDNSTAIALEEYLINDTIFLMVDGKWTSMKMPAVAGAWSQQNNMEQQVNMFNQSNLSLIGSEIIDGQDCYKIRADIDMVSFADQLSGQAASYMPMEAMNYTDLFRNMSLDVNYWITRDTHLLKRSDVVESIVVTPQSLGISSKGPESQEMRLNATVSVLFGSFNERVEIILPAEARKAQTISLEQGIFAEALPVASVGNETKINETMTNQTKTNETIARK
jgi:hypothetical protein